MSNPDASNINTCPAPRRQAIASAAETSAPRRVSSGYATSLPMVTRRTLTIGQRTAIHASA